MSLSLTYSSRLRATHTLTGPFVDPNDATVTNDQLSESDTINGSSSVPVDDDSASEITLSSGTGTLNLASMTGLTAEEVVNATTKKVQFLKLKNKSTNANKIKIARGASNGFGTCASNDDWSVTLSPGQSVLFSLDEASPDVASDKRLLDLTGTASQVLQYHVVVG